MFSEVHTFSMSLCKALPVAAGLIISPDISKYLDYLQGAGYIEFTEEKVTAYNAYANDAVIKLTKEGVDLAEGTIEDNGVDI